MQMNEIRLSGRQATLSSVVRTFDRALAQEPLARLELRYSTKCAEPFTAAQAHARIAGLLRERGMGNLEVSVRAHESLIEDATGEHVIRTKPAGASAQAAPEPARPGRILPDAVYRVFGLGAHWGAPEPATRHSPTPQNDTVAAGPALGSAEAVKLLRAAVQLGAKEFIRGAGNIATGVGVARGTAHLARVTVRLQELHATLERLVAADPTGAAAAIEKMLHGEGLACAPGFRVAYNFAPWKAGDGTVRPNQADLQVVLEGRAPGSQASDSGAGTAMPQKQPGSGSTNASAGTLMPVILRKPALRLRVLGTAQAEFATPFEIAVPRLPARIDRDLLRDSAFGRAHPEMLSVASNSCPLSVVTAQGQIAMSGATKSVAGDMVPMYYRASDRQPLEAGTALPAEGLRVLVNSPDGAFDPATGRTMPALLLEVMPG